MGGRKLFQGVGVFFSFSFPFKVLSVKESPSLCLQFSSRSPPLYLKAKLNISILQFFVFFYKMAVKSPYGHTQPFDLTAQNS